MTIGQIFMYLERANLLNDARRELMVMDKQDLPFVLSVILPEDTDLDFATKEVEKWQQINRATMKK
jgi:hypothetical protein